MMSRYSWRDVTYIIQWYTTGSILATAELLYNMHEVRPSS